jgi:streptogramin lyase
MTRRFFASFALGALLGSAACGGQNGLSTVSPQNAGPLANHSASLTFNVFTAGQTPGFPSSASAQDLTAGPGGTMWFTDAGTPAIGRIASDGTVTEFTQGLPVGALPDVIVAGPDGNMWFSDVRGVAIGRITPSGTIVEYSAPSYTNSRAMGIAFGPRGQPWFLAIGSQPLLGHLTAQGTIGVDLLPVHLTPDGPLTADASGNLWFTAATAHARGQVLERTAVGGRLVRISLQMHQAFLPCCPNHAPKISAVGLDGDLWFTTLNYGHRLSPQAYLATVKAGSVKLVRITHKGLTQAAYASGLAVGPNALWFTGGDPFAPKGALWRMNAQGRQVVYNLPFDPLGLAVDAQGHPWFTAFSNGSPSQIVEVLTTN